MQTLNKITQLATTLTDYRVIEIAGIDSQKFLQGQLTCDVVKMPEHSSTLAAHCDPKGKMISLFRLVKFSPEQFWFIFEQSLLPTALEQLKKYAVFSKVTFTEQPLSLYAFTPDQLPIKCNNDLAVSQNDAGTLIHITAEQDYYLLLTSQILDVGKEIEQWKALNIFNGTPLFNDASQGEFIPQALNLQHLEQAVSFSKGCYIGQETIARAKYRGANKFAMFTLVSESLENADLGTGVEMALENGWRRTGTIINAAHYNQQTWLQVVLNKDITPDTLFRLNENGSTYQLIANPMLEEA